MLDRIQKNIINLFNNNYNIFISGGGGTGKSFLIKYMKDLAIKEGKKIVITSTTGISALNIDGITIYNWAGITPQVNLENTNHFINTIQNNHLKLNKYLYTDILIIDEISMLDKQIFEFIDIICKSIRCNNSGFGGIQVIFVGDFYQLPPINRNNSDYNFAFMSKKWDDIVDYSIILDKYYRQIDFELVNFLKKIRKGKIDDKVVKKLDRYSNNQIDENIQTHLYPNKINVNSYNLKKLSELEGETIIKTAKIVTEQDVNYDFPENSTIVEKLMLKKGCLIIVNKNIDIEKKIVNGTQGVFQYFSNEKAVIKTIDGNFYSLGLARWDFENYYIEQYPMNLAWALTIHKSQGMGIENISIDIGENIFEPGQSYVALSRAISSKGLHIKNYSLKSIQSNNSVHKFYQKLKKEKKFWLKESDSNNKIYYINKITAETKYNLSKDDILLKDNNYDSDILLNNNNNAYHDNSLKCKFCNINGCRNDYHCWYKISICTHCLIDNPDYRQISKKELQLEFNLSDSKIKDVLSKLSFKPQRNMYNPKFRKIKIYILKQFLDKVKILDGEIIKKNIKTKNQNLKTNRIDKAYIKFTKDNKSIKEIAEDMQLSITTIENYMVEAYKLNYLFSEKDFVNLSLNLDVIDKIQLIIKNWKKDSDDMQSTLPKLKYIKDNLPKDISYLTIKLILTKI